MVPVVQDHKNALLMRVPGERLSEQSMATLQHAIARGLEIVFQLEEGEIQGFNHYDKAEQFPVDRLIEEADAGEYDALMIPGGDGNLEFFLGARRG